jgi:hypothetical protein
MDNWTQLLTLQKPNFKSKRNNIFSYFDINNDFGGTKSMGHESFPQKQTNIYDKFILISGVQLNILTFMIKKKIKSATQIRTKNLYCL